jgi:hypothetical protein
LCEFVRTALAPVLVLPLFRSIVALMDHELAKETLRSILKQAYFRVEDLLRLL